MICIEVLNDLQSFDDPHLHLGMYIYISRPLRLWMSRLRISQLAIFDTTKITAVITLLATEVAPPAESAVTYKFSKQLGGRMRKDRYRYV